MKVSELGEFGLIELLAEMVAASQERQLASRRRLILGIGDDAAAWQDEASTRLVTCDSLIQDVHFSPAITTWYELGWKALAVNLSDIAAMGGIPEFAVVSLALPGDTGVGDVTALYRGMIEMAQQFEVAIVGGDTSRAPLVAITITVLGTTGGIDKPVLTRSAARPGDKIAVTGYLGAAAAGMEMLEKQLQFDAEAAASLGAAFLKPLPLVAEGRRLVEQGVKAAIDISDGLVADLCHICRASKVGARVEVDRVPVHLAVSSNFGDRALELALSGGEDYQLLFTAGVEAIDKIKEAASCPVTVIGETTADNAGDVSLIGRDGTTLHMHKRGWDHFTGN